MKINIGLKTSSTIVRVCLLGSLLFLFQNSIVKAEMPRNAGIWCSMESGYRLSGAHKEELERSLRRITGLSGLSFGEDGSLSLGGFSSTTGSSLARNILLCVLGSGNVFIIEDHSGSPTVNFGQMDEGLNYEDVLLQRRAVIWRVRLDFEDFREMEASHEVRQSFDAGFTMLHELLHGLGYKDTLHEEEIGECEGLINQVRSELGLPLRDQYFGQPLEMGLQVVTVRLRFRSGVKTLQHRNESQRGERIHYLFFLLPPGYKPLQSEDGTMMLDCGSRR